MTEEKHIDHDLTDHIVCPFCAHNNGSEHEGDTEYEEECGGCNQEYRVSVDYSIHFSTAKFDRAAEEAVRQKRIDEHRVHVDAAKLACAKLLPGTRVQVTQEKYSVQYRGRLGTVANKELSTRVFVDLDERSVDGKCHHVTRKSFPPEELERI